MSLHNVGIVLFFICLSYPWTLISCSKRQAATDFVENAISENKIVIFSKTKCPYCKMAKDVFNELNTNYTVFELDERRDGTNIQDVLREKTGSKSVPKVFLNGKCLGGGTDVKQMHDTGVLSTLLKKLLPKDD